MSTSLLNAEILLSKEIGDHWSSTTTGAGTTTTLVDTALMAKANDWIGDESWSFLIEEPAGTAAIYDERKASSLSNTAGTLTTLAFAEAPGTGIDYEIHRMFSPSEKRRALIHAAFAGYPHIFTKVRDESIVSGNWLKDGSFEIWTSTSALTHWTTSASTIAQTTGLTYELYYKHGATSCKIDTAAGYISQGITNWEDIRRLAGENVTFTVQGWCDTADCLRLSIYDGTTTTYSDYHPGTSDWTENSEPLEVIATIADTPTEITFKVLHEKEAASETSYVDDARVISGNVTRLYIGNLGLVKDKPHAVYIEQSDYSNAEPWAKLHNVKFAGGYMYLPSYIPNDYRLRIVGLKYLDFLVSGAASTLWTATIDIDSPQLEILVAEAAIYLYTQMILPNFTAGDNQSFMQALAFWKNELRERRAKFGMDVEGATVVWR